MKLTKIEQKQHIFKINDSNKKIKVCAYCRVSTDDYDQKNSLNVQKTFFENYFECNENWINVGIFADEGISGTSLKKRDEFNKMIALAKNGGIDIIITKEVSRFSRNLRDTLNIVDELRQKKVYVIFLSDDINTENLEDSERLNEMAKNAESESRKTSKRVRFGHEQMMLAGRVFGRKEMYGYNIKKDEHGKQYFEIIEDEAEIIKQIFEWFASGDGTTIIAKRLLKMGVKTKRYKNGWSNTVILRLLRNERYVGDLMQGKTYTEDPLTHKKKYNPNGGKYYFTDHHPESAIIERDLWNKVQEVLNEKAPSEEMKIKHSNRYWMSGKVFCAVCGGRYVSVRKKLKNGQVYRAWSCLESNQHGEPKEIINDLGEAVKVGCTGKRVNEKVLQQAIYDIITEFIKPNKQKICDELLSDYKKNNKPSSTTKKIAELKKQVEQLENNIINLTKNFNEDIISKTAYISTMKSYENDVNTKRTMINKLEAELSMQNDKIKYNEYVEQIEKIASIENEDININLYGRITKKVIVHPDKILEIHLSFLPKPVFMQYEAKGRCDTYTATFTIINK